jgi:hypothetical protein
VTDPNPILAEGKELSVQGALGTLISRFSGFPIMLTLTAEYGRFVASSKRQAWSLEAVGKFNLVFDRTTPQFGSLGLGVRRIGRRSGTGFGSVDYERLSVGPAFSSRGTNLAVGLGAEVALGILTFHGSGIGVYVDTYFFEPSHMLGPETMLVLGLGYVRCAVTGMRPSVAIERSVPQHRDVSDHPCPQREALQEAIKRERKRAVDMCNLREANACVLARDRVISLSADLTACEQGENVAPPTEVDDAPVP